MATALLLIFAATCVLTLLITPLARRLARWVELLDRPDGRRKLHARATPLAGGLALFLSGAVVLTLVTLLPGPTSRQLAGEPSFLLGLLLAAVVLCAVGVADDYGCLRGRHKLLGQLLAVCVLLCHGLVVRRVSFFGQEIALGPLSLPVTGLWLLGAINSLNLLDGMDGLLSSIGLILSLALALMAALMGHWPAACVACVLAGGLLGFLRYNFPPASVFLGDCGSMLVGLTIGFLAIEGSMKGPATVVLAIPTALLTIPFFDTAAAIARRKLTGRSIYATDRGHLHHCLLRQGLSPRRVLFWVGLACLLTSAGALASLTWQNEAFALLAAFTVVGVSLCTRLFGYSELLLLNRSLLRLVTSFVSRGGRVGNKHVQVRIQGSVPWQEVWNEMINCADRLNLAAVRFDVNAPAIQEGYHAFWQSGGVVSEESSLWRVEIPLSADGQVVACLVVSGRLDDQPVSGKLADMAKLAEYFEQTVAALAGSETLKSPERNSMVVSPGEGRIEQVRA